MQTIFQTTSERNNIETKSFSKLKLVYRFRYKGINCAMNDSMYVFDCGGLFCIRVFPKLKDFSDPSTF